MQDSGYFQKMTEGLIHTYYLDQDWNAALSYFDRNQVSWIGVSDQAMALDYDKLKVFFENGCNSKYEIRLLDENYSMVSKGEDFAVVIAQFLINSRVDKNGFFSLRQRASFIFHLCSGQWKVTHMHVSAPNSIVREEEYYPEEMSVENYRLLKRLLIEKTQQMEMLAQTTAGGMRGSLDDENYTFFYVNDELCNMLGYTYDEFMEMSGGTAKGAIYPPDVAKAMRDCRECFKKGDEYKTEYRIRKKDGTLLWVMDYGKKVRNANQESIINSILTDISEIKETIGQLEMEKERNEIVSELSDDIIFDYNMREDELQVFYPASVAGEKHKKIIKNARVSEGWKELGVSPEDEAEIYEKIMDISNDKISNKTIKAEYQIADGNGKNIWRRVLMRGVFDSEGNLAKVVGKVVDISSEKELMLRSSTDSLTSAYNRSYLELAVKKAIRNKGVDLYYACLLIDIDFFKEINDKFGHLQGDCVLIEVVKMCRTLFRSTDIVARLGGDEFMIFMRDRYDQKIVLEKARKMLDIAENYCIREGLPDRLSLSMGIVIDDDVATNFKQLYHQADIALYQAKQNGRGRYVVFEEGMMHPSD